MDDFDDTQTGLNSPIVNADAITPDNAADLARSEKDLASARAEIRRLSDLLTPDTWGGRA